MVYIAVGMVVFVALCAAAHRWFRSHALALEHGDGPTAERVHGLQRLALWQSGALSVLFALMGGAVGVGAGLVKKHHDGDSDKVALLVALLVAVIAVALSMRGTVRPALARVRDVPIKPANRRRMLAATVPMSLVIVAAFAVMFALAPNHGGGRIVVLVVGYLFIVVVLQSLLAPLLVVGLRSRPLPDETYERLRRLARQMGVRVDVRAFDGREQKIANAAQIGTIPRLRYVLVTDYLLDNLDDDEVDAVVAHEFGHLRGRHVLIKMLAVVAVWAILETLLVLARGSNGHDGTALLIAPLAIAFPIGIVLVNGLVGVRLEERADDNAARQVGSEALAAALAKLGQLNHTKRDTGRAWSLLTQHPGLDRRIERLQNDATPTGPARVQG